MITIHNFSHAKTIPHPNQFKKWATAVLGSKKKNCSVSISVVTPKTSQQLNTHYRSKNKPTNVLSFPFLPTPGATIQHLGDIIICAAIVKREAKEQKKPVLAHWAHMTIHGVLHLMGYDHVKLKDAKIMEQKEVKILRKLGISAA